MEVYQYSHVQQIFLNYVPGNPWNGWTNSWQLKAIDYDNGDSCSIFRLDVFILEL